MGFKYLQINKKLLPIKTHYFFWNAGLSTIQPHLSSYARQLGFSSVVVGFLFTVMPIMSIIFRPLLGMAADKFNRQRELFIGSQILLLVSSMGILFIPALDVKHASVNLLCSSDQTAVLQIPEKVINNCTLNRYKTHKEFEIIKLRDENNMDTSEFIGTFLTEKIVASYDFLKVPIKQIIDENSTVFLCSETNGTSYQIYNEHFNNYIYYPEIGPEHINTKYWYWLFFTVMVCFNIGYGTVTSLADAVCFDLLEDNPSKYGQQRLFGALGWGIFSVISGFVTDLLSDGRPILDYSFCFYTSFVLICIDIIVCIKMEFSQNKTSKTFIRDIGQFFLNIRNNVFFIWCACLGICTALMWQFLYWLIEDLLSKEDCNLQYFSKTLEGLIQFIETIMGEIPCFFFSGWIMKKFGYTNIMSLILLCLGIRIFLYCVIPNPWWFLPVELMNGIDFGLCFCTMASYASSIAPEGTESTMQSLVGAIYEGIGIAIGSSVAGISCKEHGGVKTFKYFAYFALIAAILHVIIQYTLKCKSKKKLDSK